MSCRRVETLIRPLFAVPSIAGRCAAIAWLTAALACSGQTNATGGKAQTGDGSGDDSGSNDGDGDDGSNGDGDTGDKDTGDGGDDGSDEGNTKSGDSGSDDGSGDDGGDDGDDGDGGDDGDDASGDDAGDDGGEEGEEDSDTDDETPFIPDSDPHEFENDYQRKLSKALRFYGAQRCGDANNWLLKDNPEGNSCHWQDGEAKGIDLVGGWHDAGDFIKFSLTNGYAAYAIMKAYDAFPQSFKDRDDENYGGEPNGVPDVLDEAKHALEYLARILTDSGDLVYRIGGNQDHQIWVTSPHQSKLSVAQGGGARPVYVGGKSDIAGMAASALALGSHLFKPYDPDTSERYKAAALALYDYGLANEGTTEDNYYEDTRWQDNMLCAAVELMRITGDESYRPTAQEHNKFVGWTGWVMDWASPAPLCRHTFYNILGDKDAFEYLEGDATHNMKKVSDDPEIKGLAYFDLRWGVLRYAAGASFTNGLTWISIPDWPHRDQFEDFATTQIDWILGDNPYGHSFVIGDGDGAPQYPHHKNAYGRDPYDFPQGGQLPLHELTGAMIAGPDMDGWQDDITDFVRNEVTIDYNANYVGALAGKAYMVLYHDQKGDD